MEQQLAILILAISLSAVSLCAIISTLLCVWKRPKDSALVTEISWLSVQAYEKGLGTRIENDRNKNIDQKIPISDLRQPLPAPTRIVNSVNADLPPVEDEVVMAEMNTY